MLYLKSSKFPLVATLIVLIAFGVMIKLGFWQLQRAEQKSLRLEQITQRQQSDPFTLSELTAKQDDIRDYPVSASGYVQQTVLLVDNRVRQGKVGYEVIAPLKTNEGMLLVDFGWIAAGQYRDQLPEVSLPKELVSISGMVSMPINNPMITETAMTDGQWPKVIQQNDSAVIERLLGYEVLPFTLLLSEQSQLGYHKQWTPVVMPPEKHIGYAIQWFGLAIACLLVYLFAVFSFRKNKNKKNKED